MIGATFGPYRILNQLGSGGMGVVYRAEDTQLDRIVALKFLPHHLSSEEESKRRFLQEAKAASALDHANICTIHHIGETDEGDVYIVMSFYEGQTLKYLLENGPLPEDRAVSITKQVAAGLSVAHAAGIVHRDIKPANIMVTDQGEVKILDFGIAKLGESSDLTREGSTLGTVAYMSPEQSRGESVGPATDLWSLGVLLYEMVSGKRPFEATYDQALVYSIINEPAPNVRDVAPDISAETAAVVGQLLSKDSSDRPESAAEVVELLGGATGTVYAGTGIATGSSSPTGSASFRRVVIAFTLLSGIALAFVYSAMMLLGLPDWVFPAGVMLVLAGAPIMLYATRLEKQKASMDTAARGRLSGLSSWLSLKKAAFGGGLALAGLGAVTVGFMTMRAMGIGPAATLITSGQLNSDDLIVVADFDDQTSAHNMGVPIAEALRVDLRQSNVVQVMDPSTVSAALVRMELPGDTTLSSELANEVSIREGAKAVVTGDVASLGSSFVINLRLTESGPGGELVSLRATADTDADIVRAVDQLSSDLRKEIGESLVSIRSSTPLAQVTTSSLEALRLYTLAYRAKNREDSEAAIEYATRAVEIDPEFAMAYRIMAAVENNRHGSPTRMIEYARKAYEYRDRLPPVERLRAISAYNIWVERNYRKNVTNWLAMLESNPEDMGALNGLGLVYRYSGDVEKAIEYSRRVIAAQPDRTLGYINTFYALTRTGDWDEAEAMLDSILAIEPAFADYPWMKHSLYAERTGNYEAALDSFKANFDREPTGKQGYFNGTFVASIEMMLGRYDDAARTIEKISDIALEMGNPSGALNHRLRYITMRYFAENNLEWAYQAHDEAVRLIPPAEMDTLDRAYLGRGYSLAALGRSDEAREVLEEQATYVPEPWLMQDDAGRATEGLIALQEGRYEDAITHLEWVRNNMNMVSRYFQFELGSALFANDRLQEAVETLEEGSRGTGWQALMLDFGASTLALRSLGEVYDRMGRTKDAIDAYSQFLIRWDNADSQLQPQIAEVQNRVDVLAAMLASEQ